MNTTINRIQQKTSTSPNKICDAVAEFMDENSLEYIERDLWDMLSQSISNPDVEKPSDHYSSRLFLYKDLIKLFRDLDQALKTEL